MNKMRVLGSTLLVSGMAIGAGMLSLPSTTAAFGFGYTMLLCVISVIFTITSALYLLEATLPLKEGASIVSVSQYYFGISGKILSWSLNTLFLYAILVAYLVGGGGIFKNALFSAYHLQLPDFLSELIFLLTFGVFVYFGTRAVDYINRLMMLGLGGFYIALLVFVMPHAKLSLLTGGEFQYVWYCIPLIVLSFTMQLVIPALRDYHKSNTKELTLALVLGTLIPFLFYALWELTILGILPKEGPMGLLTINQSGNPAAVLFDALHKVTGIRSFGLIVGAFSFFALVTSFLGAAITLMHALKDGFKLPATVSAHWANMLMTFVPAYLLALFFPDGFLKALRYASIMIAILFGIMPTLMVLKSRYLLKHKSAFQVPGGLPLVLLILAGSILMIVAQVLADLKMIPIS